jgi:hypothetical protein
MPGFFENWFRGLRLKHLRIGAAFALLGVMFISFVPVLYDPTMFACREPRTLCLSDPSGLKSLGYLLFQWGATYGFELGYSAPAIDQLTTFGVLIGYAFPLGVICLDLLSPELTRISKITRFLYIALGAFAVLTSVSLVFSREPSLSLVAVILAPTGVLMVAYGTRILIFAGPPSTKK